MMVGFYGLMLGLVIIDLCEHPTDSTVLDLALIASLENDIKSDLETVYIKNVTDNLNSTMETSVRLNIEHFKETSGFVNETIQDCPYSIVIAMVSCEDNQQLYKHLRDHCFTAVLFSLFEFTCQRPPKDIGIGIPNHGNIKNFIPIITDISNTLNSKWNKIITLYEDDLDVSQFNEFTRITKGCSNGLSHITAFHMQFESYLTNYLSAENTKVLENLKHDTGRKVIIVIGGRVLLEKILRTLKEMAMITFENKWIMILTGGIQTIDLDEESKSIISVSNMLLLENVQNENCMALKDDCLRVLLVDLIKQAIKKVLNDTSYSFKGPTNIVMRTKNRFLSQIKSILTSINFTAKVCGNCDHYQISSLYKHRTNDIVDPNNDIVQVNYPNLKFEIVTENNGNWNPYKGLLLKEEDDSDTNLKNRPLNIGISEQPPLVRIYRNGLYGNSTQEIVGTNYQIILVLAAKLNFTPNFIINPTTNIGHLWPNGSWSGLFRQIIDGEIDIGANGFWKTSKRSEAVHFTFPFSLEEISMLVKKTDEDHKYLFLAPFTWDAWLCILVTVLFMGPFLWFVHRSSKYYEYYKLNNGRGLYKLGNCVWYCFGAIVQQGGDYLPHAVSGRILITFWWLFVIVTVTTYSGNLVALLTFPKIFNPINDFNDLLRYKNVLKYGAIRNRGIEELIIQSENTPLRALSDNIVFYDPTDLQTIFDLVKEMKLVFLASNTEIRYLISEDFKQYNTCQLMIAKDSILTRSISFIINNSKPKKFKEKIDFEIARMSKSGLTTLWNRKYEVNGNDCLYPLIVRAGDVKKIGLSHMVDCFFVLGLGLFIGILSLLIEIVKQNKKQKPIQISLPNIRPEKGILRFIFDLYEKIKSGRLYENWFETSPNVAPVKENSLNVNPALTSYYTYSNSIKDNVHKPLGWNSTLQRQQKMYYFQKNLDLHRKLTPSNHFY